MPNPLQQLWQYGQSFWYDNIRRELLTGGGLARMVREDGLRGLTSNPTIFAKAISGSADYDGTIRKFLPRSAEDIFLELAIEDIQGACDTLRPVYDECKGKDGYASIEVFPDLAHDLAGTVKQARLLWQRVSRPNVMVKVPSTPECIPAIRTLLAEGININITLMFDFNAYQTVAEAYLAALEERMARGQAVDRIGSVASLFVSRVDTKLDPMLEDLATTNPQKAAELLELQGKAGIANARRMYRHFEQTFAGPRWKILEGKGAHPQRLLWASTSTKNPKYPDTLYAEALVGPETVDTMPDATVEAYRDHGRPMDRLSPAMKTFDAEVTPVLTGLKNAGLNLEKLLVDLQNEGVDKFGESFNELMASLKSKQAALRTDSAQGASGTSQGNMSWEATPGLEQAAKNALAGLKTGRASARIWQRDAAFWSNDAAVRSKIKDRLGWLDVGQKMLAAAPEIAAFVQECRAEKFKHAVLLGMGGSSLAPEVFSEVFAGDRTSGVPLHVVDTTDPDTLAHLEAKLDLARTLFIVSSKSGGTIEPNSLFAYFWDKAPQGSQYIAITDPGTSLEKLAKDHGFRRVFVNPSDIGGRYSALSYFGLVPAALLGVDVVQLLQRAQNMAQLCAASIPDDDNPGLRLGAALGAWALRGHDKLTFLASPGLKSLGAWLEQLIAESTGKSGKGIVPVDGETPGPASVYGADRIFVLLQLRGEATLARPGSQTGPLVRIDVSERLDLGQEFFRWEFATASAGAVMGINPFDEPNVQESKDNTLRVLKQYLSGGNTAAGFEAPAQSSQTPLRAFAPQTTRGARFSEMLRHWLMSVKPGDYVAVTAYLERTESVEVPLQRIRLQLRDTLRAATTLGFGPRFLHSTGQLHKGGPATGVFLQLTSTPAEDRPIPGQSYSFATLLAAQAMGDYESLEKHERRLLRIDLGKDIKAGLEALQQQLELAGLPAENKAAD